MGERYGVSFRGSHGKLETTLKEQYKAAVANAAGGHGSVERMVTEIVRTLEVVLQEERHDLREWVSFVLAVRWGFEYCSRSALREHAVLCHIWESAANQFFTASVGKWRRSADRRVG